MKKKIIPILMAILVATTMSIQTASGITVKDKDEILDEFSKLSNGKEEIYLEEDGSQVFVKGTLAKNVDATASDTINFLDENKALFNIQSDDSDFELQKIENDELGYTHIFVDQTFDGTKVYGKNLVVHFNDKGEMISLTGSLENKIDTIVKSRKSPISESKAIEIAENSKEYNELSEKAVAEKYVYYKDSKAYEVYKINVVYDAPTYGSWDVFVDIYSGDIIDSINLIREGSVTGSGTAVNGDTRTLNLNQSGSYYYLQDRTKPMNGYISTYTANYRSTTTGSLMYSRTTNVTDAAAVSAHSYAEVVYNFYKNMFNRNSIDNNGMSINSVVHYGSSYNNAFWNGYKMVYGDGDGSIFKSLSGDLDVVGHEMTHGVTTNTCNLDYENQPGALNESMSDVFGVLVQTYDKYNVSNGGTWQFNAADWVVGDEIYTPNTPGDALRSLADPTLYDQPAHMNNYENLPNTSSGDYGGVHTNSGIPNKAGYLVAQNIGCEKTANIYYRALTLYFNNTTNFAQARLGLVHAAEDLYGANSTEAQAVKNAYSAVGIN